MENVNKKYTVVSLFSGAGLCDKAFIDAGFSVIDAQELKAAICKTYRYNLGLTIVNEDIRLPETFPEADVLIGGLPCEGYSLAGKRDPKDDRNSLYKEFLRAVGIIKPKVFVIENVPGSLSMLAPKLIEEAAKIGYTVSYANLMAADYGVAQTRSRIC